MEDKPPYISMVIFVIVIAVFLFFGYRDDYRRNPKGFWKTIFGVPLAILGMIFGIFGLQKFLKKWMNDDDENIDIPR